jgi:hypothetical protein
MQVLQDCLLGEHRCVVGSERKSVVYNILLPSQIHLFSIEA